MGILSASFGIKGSMHLTDIMPAIEEVEASAKHLKGLIKTISEAIRREGKPVFMAWDQKGALIGITFDSACAERWKNEGVAVRTSEEEINHIVREILSNE